MKTLTRNEIVEIRARAICKALGFNPDITCDIYIENDPDAGCAWAGYRNIAQATIEADEEAGILMLVEDEPKMQDIVFDGKAARWCAKTDEVTQTSFYLCDTGYYEPFDASAKTIFRNDVLAYHCRGRDD